MPGIATPTIVLLVGGSAMGFGERAAGGKDGWGWGGFEFGLGGQFGGGVLDVGNPMNVATDWVGAGGVEGGGSTGDVPAAGAIPSIVLTPICDARCAGA